MSDLARRVEELAPCPFYGHDLAEEFRLRERRADFVSGRCGLLRSNGFLSPLSQRRWQKRRMKRHRAGMSNINVFIVRRHFRARDRAGQIA